ncbi:aldehyde dehydrogenase family protein [Pseudofrankia sp. DC12]|uniref:aldehyde dehydrogenase family protein n=1 Tax=Pseudofrankia sp. DC12 TaxID=683315 RepID=UPI000A65F128|nr:aldehyde dehydrogenase family protein [Pseudofrankia sp. DC12]
MAAVADHQNGNLVMTDYYFVAGIGLPVRGRLDVRNPADHDDVVGTIPELTAADVARVVRAADRAQKGWGARTPRARYDLLAAALAGADVTGADVLLTRENGKVLADSTRELGYLDFPVRFLAEHLDWLADGDDLGDSGRHRTRVLRRPFGVVGILTPWNVPIGMSVVTIAPALLAGNAVVAHIPPTCPLTVLRVFGQLAGALPPGVLSLICAPDPTIAQALVEHPLVRNVHFTGSTAVGALVAREAAGTMATVTLELGGNDPAIVLDDAFDDGALYQRLAASAFGFGGQACVALKRLYVPRSRVAEVVDGLGSVLSSTVVGDGLDPATTLGPLHTARGRARVRGLVQRSGGDVHEFGKLAGDPAKGNFLLPVVVSGLDNTAPLVREEQFGPALPVVAYDSVDEAVAMANDSEFGLASSVWSADQEAAAQVAGALEAGMTWINMHAGAAIDGRAPWGGVKLSGVGRGGANRAGLEGFTEPHAITWPGSAA